MKNIFKKNRYINLTPPPTKRNEADVPLGSWVKCKSCGEVIFKKSLIDSAYVCPHCQKHFRMSAYDRLTVTIDEGSFEELFTDLLTKNFLDFPGYDEKIKALKKKTVKAVAKKVTNKAVAKKKRKAVAKKVTKIVLKKKPKTKKVAKKVAKKAVKKAK